MSIDFKDASVGAKPITSDLLVSSTEILSNGLLKVTFSDGVSDYFHPDALADFAEDFADDDDIVWPSGGDDNPPGEDGDDGRDDDDDPDDEEPGEEVAT